MCAQRRYKIEAELTLLKGDVILAPDNIRQNEQSLKQQVTAGKKAHMDVRTETL